jgi:hypothetical protein
VDDSIDMKARIERVLSDAGYSESRAAKMDINDLLKQVLTYARVASHSPSLHPDSCQHSTTSVCTLLRTIMSILVLVLLRYVTLQTFVSLMVKTTHSSLSCEF